MKAEFIPDMNTPRLNSALKDGTVVIVPKSSLGNYYNATNWATASIMIGSEYIDFAEEPLFVPMTKLEERIQNLE